MVALVPVLRRRDLVLGERGRAQGRHGRDERERKSHGCALERLAGVERVKERKVLVGRERRAMYLSMVERGPCLTSSPFRLSDVVWQLRNSSHKHLLLSLC